MEIQPPLELPVVLECEGDNHPIGAQHRFSASLREGEAKLNQLSIKHIVI